MEIYSIPQPQMILVMTTGLFILGLITFVTGIIILITRSFGKDIRILTQQTAKLTQKGFAEDVAGLVGNASALLTATSDLVKTAAGVGVFLTVIGLILMSTAVGVVLYTNIG